MSDRINIQDLIDKDAYDEARKEVSGWLSKIDNNFLDLLRGMVEFQNLTINSEEVDIYGLYSLLTSSSFKSYLVEKRAQKYINEFSIKFYENVNEIIKEKRERKEIEKKEIEKNIMG